MKAVEARAIDVSTKNLSIMKAFDIIEFLADENNEPQRLRDIADALGMNASTVSRFVSSLVDRGYILQDHDTSRYFLSTRFCSIANAINSNDLLYNLCMPVMREISKVVNESVCLAIEQNAEVEYIGVVPAAGQMLQIMQRIGKRAPMHCTGIGKLLLSNHSREEMLQIAREKGLPSFTQHTITSEENLLAEVYKVKQQGYAYDNEECEIGARCIALPLTDPFGKIVAGISITGPVFRLTDEWIEEIFPYFSEQVRKLCKKI